MFNLDLRFYIGSNADYFVTYLDPFTNLKVRTRFVDRKSAEDFKKEITDRFSKDLVEKSNELRVGDLLIHFINELPDNHFVKNRWLFTDFSQTFSNLKIKDLTTDDLKSWLEQLRIEGNYSPRTMETLRVYTNHFFRFLISKKIITASPAKGIRYMQHSAEMTRKPTLLTKAKIDDLKEKAKNYSPGYFYPIFLTVIETAAKTTEILSLKWSHIDLKNKTVTLTGQKTLTERTIKISDELAQLLENKRHTSDFVFTNLYGKQFTKKQLGYAMTEFKRHHNIKEKWMYFDLRHSFARNYLEDGGTMTDLQKILGIRSTDTAREVYGYQPSKNLNLKSPFEDQSEKCLL